MWAYKCSFATYVLNGNLCYERNQVENSPNVTKFHFYTELHVSTFFRSSSGSQFMFKTLRKK
jgi:hypothetical protein